MARRRWRSRRKKRVFLRPGDFFGEMSLLDGGPRSVTVRAATSSRVLVIDRKNFQGVLREVPDLTEKLLVTPSRQVRARRHLSTRSRCFRLFRGAGGEGALSGTTLSRNPLQPLGPATRCWFGASKNLPQKIRAPGERPLPTHPPRCDLGLLCRLDCASPMKPDEQSLSLMQESRGNLVKLVGSRKWDHGLRAVGLGVSSPDPYLLGEVEATTHNLVAGPSGLAECDSGWSGEETSNPGA